MKPNFALSLSFEGIRLLHRAAGGWRRVGEVPVTSADLAGDLAALRHAAARLDDAPLRTKLIIPDDQIKYLSIDTGDVDTDARRSAALAALDGATPYAVDVLVFDICPDDTVTHVAAVARETLAEAEAFASEHGFHPVCFVAAPTDQEFLGAPWFGAAAHARAILEPGETVEADGVRVVIVGDVETPGDSPVEDAAPDVVADPPEVAPAPEVALAVDEVPEPVPDAPVPADPPLHFNPVADDAEDVPPTADEDAEVADGALLGFASRRSTPPPPAALGGVTRTPTGLTVPPKPGVHSPGKAPLTPPAAAAHSLRAEPVFASRSAPATPARAGGFLSRRSAAPQPVPAGGPPASTQSTPLYPS